MKIATMTMVMLSGSLDGIGGGHKKRNENQRLGGMNK